MQVLRRKPGASIAVGVQAMTTTEEKSRSESLASLSPGLAWNLLTPTEQQLITDYLIKVLEQEVKQKEERKLALTNIW